MTGPRVGLPRIKTTDSLQGPSGNQIQSIAEDYQGNVWMAIAGSGINRLEKATGKFTHYVTRPGDSTSLSNNYATCVLVSRMGVLWVGTSKGGLNRLDAKTGKFIRLSIGKTAPYTLPNNTVTAMTEDPADALAGQLWRRSESF